MSWFRKAPPPPPSDSAHLMTPEEILEKRKIIILQEAIRIEKALLLRALDVYKGKKFKYGWLIKGRQGAFNEEAIALAHERLEDVGWKIEFVEQTDDKRSGTSAVWYYYGGGNEAVFDKHYEEAKGVPVQ